MHSATAASLRMIIAGHFRVKPNRIANDTRLSELGADWLDRLELLLVIEDKLPELQTSKLIVGDIETVGDLLRALEDLSPRDKPSTLFNQGSRELLPKSRLVPHR